MKKALGVALAAVIVLSAVAMATGDKAVSGTISRLDTASKSMVIKDTTGKEVTVFWDDATRVTGGELREGSQVEVQTKDQDGKNFATSIQIRATKPY
ncbi:MAG: hypothetical protein ACM3SU_02445 [Acidobacteriota bacterium]